MNASVRAGRGFTLIEFIVALVVLGLGSALLVSFVTPTAGSADPMIQAQARAIAAAYVDEILLRNYLDDNGQALCQGDNRATWSTIWCYNQLPAGQAPQDQFGNAIPALADYRVAVAVGGGNPATIRVDVTHSSGRGGFSLQSARGNY